MNYHLIMDDNSSFLLNRAFVLHKAGKLEEAKFIYEKLYAFDSNNTELINLYAQLLTSLQNYDFALELFSKLYELTKIQDAQINIAKVYILKNDYEEATNLLLKLDCSNIEVMSLLVSCSMKRERYNDAKLILEDLVKINNSYINNYNLAICYKVENEINKALDLMLPFEEEKSDNIQFLSFMGSLYKQLNQPENELFYLQKIGLLTNNTNVLRACAIIAEKLEKYDLALFYLNTILEIIPNHLETMIFIANIYKNIDLKIAFDLFVKLHNNHNDNADILIALCTISRDLIKYVDLKIYVDKLSSLENIPQNAFSVIAYSYYILYNYEKSLKYWELTLKYFPDNDNFKAEYAEILAILGRVQDAREITSKILHIPNAARTYAETFIRNRNFEPVRDLFLTFSDKKSELYDLLNKGKFAFNKMDIGGKYNISENDFIKIGEEIYNKEKLFIENLHKKRLKDNDYKNKKLLIYSAQGVGDIIMNLRYLSYFSDITDNITLSVPNSLLDIVKYNFPMFKDVRSGMVSSIDEFDYVTTYIALIYNLKLDFDFIPFSSGYLKIREQDVIQKSKLDIFRTKKKKVGIFWQGNPMLFYNRSAKLKNFLPLINNEKLQVYSFQLEDINDNCKMLLSSSNIIDLSPYIKNYTDTAAFLFNIDVLVTIDTSIAHLAGALGIKTYLMLPYDSEWRWFYDTKTTPWYDSVTIFKQTIPNDWDSVIERINKEIENGF